LIKNQVSLVLLKIQQVAAAISELAAMEVALAAKLCKGSQVPRV